MDNASDSSCDTDIQEREEKKEVGLQEKRSWHKNFMMASSQPRKKVKFDASHQGIPSRSSVQSPFVETIAIDCSERTKSSSPPQDLSSDEYHEPTEKDVVFGKGRFIQNLAGNVRLRKLIKSHFDQYESADCPQDKTLMAMRLVVDIKESGGKFLKEDASAPGRYVEVSSVSAREKIAATFHSHRRRSKQSKIEAPTNESKKMPVTTSTQSGVRSSMSLPVGAKATDRIRPFPGPSGLGSQGMLFGSSPVYTSSVLQHELNVLSRRALELSGEMARITANEFQLKKSIDSVCDRVHMEKCARAAVRDNMLRKPSSDLSVGGGSLSPNVQKGMPAPGNKNRANSLAFAPSAGPTNSHGRSVLVSASNAKMNNLRSSKSSSSQIMSSPVMGASSRRVLSPTRAIETDSSSTSSGFETPPEYPSHCTSHEALQAQLYREMGLPGF